LRLLARAGLALDHRDGATRRRRQGSRTRHCESIRGSRYRDRGKRKSSECSPSFWPAHISLLQSSPPLPTAETSTRWWKVIQRKEVVTGTCSFYRSGVQERSCSQIAR